MDDVFSRLEASKTRKATTVLGGADYDELPLVSKLLAGVLAPDGIMWERPPYKLLWWLEEGGTKFLFFKDDDWPKVWGTTSGLAQGILGIEKALAAGSYGIQNPKSNGQTLTHVKR